MKFRFSQPIQEASTPNLTPLIDVVFLLLIFFMVSSTFLETSAIEIRLPEASGKPPEDQPQALVVKVKADGDFEIGELVIPAGSRAGLGAVLERQANPDAGIIVAADARSPHQAVMTLLDLSSQIGVNSVRFEAQEPK